MELELEKSVTEVLFKASWMLNTNNNQRLHEKHKFNLTMPKTLRMMRVYLFWREEIVEIRYHPINWCLENTVFNPVQGIPAGP